MTRSILHISDLHIGESEVRPKRLRELLKRVRAKWGKEPAGKKPVVVVAGDIVDDGEEAQFIEASEMLLPLESEGFPLVCVPGNHDYGWNGCHAVARRFSLFKKYCVGIRRVSYPDVFEFDNLALIALNSMKAETGLWDGFLADGEVGERQLDELGEILHELQPSRQRGLKVAVCLHHHPFLFPDDSLYEKAYEWAGHCLKDGADLMRMVSGRIDALLFGHEHRHVDFSRCFPDAALPAKHSIPVIASCGRSTDAGCAWLIDLSDDKRPIRNPWEDKGK